MDGMVAALQKLGDGFLKMERIKMDIVGELESMRMKMEIKQTKMIIESYQKVVDTFAETIIEKKNKKI
ncbi:hypothetical protein L2E82_42309 [Cichorium intybus]|uniref:Uncharacterized protein n=1 Tax=Cichorium intybus TaxID=13427 RepID=A0ACB8ZM54_CICIN|nr:hypothetical protein L2E82_42309 [Cichorium intybus]